VNERLVVVKVETSEPGLFGLGAALALEEFAAAAEGPGSETQGGHHEA